MTQEAADTPPIEEVEDFPGGIAVPVRVVESIRVDQLPTVLVDPRTYLIKPGDSPKLLLREDPRRARATLFVANMDIMVSGRGGNLEKFGGGWLPSGIPYPLTTNIRSALYARGVFMDTSGTDVQFTIATDIAVVTVWEERWSN